MTAPDSEHDAGDAGTTFTAPGTPHARVRVYDGVPGTGRKWIRTAGRVSGLLLALAAAGREGRPLPDELAGRRALGPWLRISQPVVRAVQGTTAEETTFALAAEDLAQLARMVTALRGRSRIDLDAAATVLTVLHDEAEVHDCTPTDLVDELARVYDLLR